MSSSLHSPKTSIAIRVAVVLFIGSGAAARGEPVDFARDVYPIFQRSCFECHGPKKQKSGLRLDQREAAMRGGDGGDTIVAGKPEASELARRIALPKSDEEVMPNRGEPLTKSEIECVREWITAGAPWPDNLKPATHWAYVAPIRPALPKTSALVSNPIDAFVRARLEQEGLAASPVAEPHVLARRLFLDLIGLPPTPAEAEAFAAAAGRDLPGAVERLADDLMARPQYGEKWARPWLDAARYADSHGFQRDDLRELWPYRDWVIRALNDDMPFDRFTIEQLAGDLLPDATEAQRIATGFNRSAPCNVEAGTDPEENRVNQVLDRVNTIGMVWLGTTLECCQCHDHKYDPFTQADYYSLVSFFNSTELEADRSNPKVPGSIRFLGPYMEVSSPETEAELARLRREVAAAKAALSARVAKLTQAPTGSESSSAGMQEHPLTPADFESSGGANHRILEDGSILLAGDPPATDTYTVTVRTSLKEIVGFKLEALTDPSLPGMGPGRGDPERTNFVLNSFTVTAAPEEREAEAQPVKLTDARADFSQTGWDVGFAVDTNPKTGWGIAPQFHRPHWATFRAAQPIVGESGVVLTFRLVQELGGGRTIGRLRLSALTGSYPAAPLPPKSDPERSRLEARVAELEKELKEAALPRTLVMHELGEPRPSAIFKRGDFRNPGAPVHPVTPAILPPFEPKGPPNRVALAEWLVSRQNPLTARVTVNRLWSELFGEGIVSTPEDFGIKGERPSHPELLDWLAVEFMENGWSQKKLLRLIVTSSTYRQASRVTPELLERDPRNRLLARGPRLRLSAEAIRDNALAIAGLLSLKQFGPPIRPPQPANLWDKVGGQKYDYVVSPGEEQYRRGVYVVLKRGAPYPSFVNFDANARLACRVKRNRSNTPLQALTLLNDPVYVEAAQALAARLVRERTEPDSDVRLRYGFELAVARPPASGEIAALRNLYHSELAANGAEAAWLAVASALLNLDETITKE